MNELMLDIHRPQFAQACERQSQLIAEAEAREPSVWLCLAESELEDLSDWTRQED